jgi:DNA (cytosine-5)-methyltransferase 1
MRYLSVCSGMEAASVAWHPLGWTPVGFSEIEPFPCAILKHRFPHTPNYGSLTEYKQWPLEPGAIDLLVGGTPCQSFSVAGLRKGLDDPRGNLALVFLGLADKLKPRWIVWENVPGVLSSNGGRDLGSFLGALVQLGYGFAYRVLDAQHFGVPQRRRRIILVACLGDWRAPAEVLLEPDCVRRDSKKGRAKGQSPAAGAEGGVDANGLQRTVGTLCADTHPGAYSGQDAYTGRLIPQTVCATGDTTHCLTASQKGATEDGTGRGTPIVIDRAAFNQGQNAQYEPHIVESEVMDSLVARGPHAVGQPLSHWDGSDVHPTLNQSAKGSGGVGASNQELFSQGGAYLVPGQPIPIHDQATRFGGKRGDKQDGKGNGLGIGKPGDPMNTLTRGDHHAVATVYSFDSLASNSMKSSNPISGCREVDLSKTIDTTNPCPSKNQGGLGILQTPPMAVRRLTPVECERLQGFPDNWSRISWKGKPEDQCPDGPRYKACGNSMAVPVMRWIGERIAAADAKHFPNA